MTKSAAPRTKRAMTAATTARLMAAARDAFATQGFASVPAEALTADLGLTRGALYHHFGGKEGLFAAVVRALEDEIAARLTAVWEATPDPAIGLVAVCEGWLDFACDPGVQRILFRDAPAVLGPRASALDGEASRTALTEAIAALPHPTPAMRRAMTRRWRASLMPRWVTWRCGSRQAMTRPLPVIVRPARSSVYLPGWTLCRARLRLPQAVLRGF